MTFIVPLIIVGRLLLAGVFGLAGISKLLDLDGSRQGLRDFGVPDTLTRPGAVLLPTLELAVALALIPASTVTLGASGAVALLLLFITAIGVTLARGRAPSCHCFGQLRARPVGGKTLLRNALLAGLAVLVLIAPVGAQHANLFGWLMPLSLLQSMVGGTLLALLVVQSTVLVKKHREIRELRTTPVAASSAQPQRVAGRAIGSIAPSFALADLSGGTITLEHLASLGKPIILFFFNPTCGPCKAMLSDLTTWQKERSDRLTLAIVSKGTPDVNLDTFGAVGVPVLIQRGRETAEAYSLLGTPSAVVVQPDLRIGSVTAQAEEQIRQLVTDWSSAEEHKTAAPIAAPNFHLTSLEGTEISLGTLSGKPTLLLFWNPGCGFCRKMLGDLRVWESRPLDSRTAMLVISTGTIEENQALGLRSPIAIDASFSVGRSYGFTGTPSAALIDEKGLLVQSVLGGSAILGLIGQPESSAEMPIISAFPEPGSIWKHERTPVAIALPQGSKPIRHECVQDELLSDGSIVLYNSCRRKVITLNATGALVWELCDGKRDIDALTTELQELFPDVTTVGEDVRAIVDNLLQSSMIVPAVTTGDPQDDHRQPINA